MGKYALIVTETGRVDNVIEYDGVSPFNPGTGMELREAEANAEIGGTWNGSEFVRAPVIPPTRTQVLMQAVTTDQKWDSDAEEVVDKTDDEIAAEKAELLALLHAALVAGELNQPQTQIMLILEPK